MRQAIFMDRDGTLNKDNGYSPRLELYKDVIPFFERVAKLDIQVITISNQSNVATGKVTNREVQSFNDWLSILVGYPIKGYYCPHSREDRCCCRKPEPGLIYKAAIENNINVGSSFFIGNEIKDIEAARAANMFNYLVKREQDFTPSMSAYISACRIPVYTLEESMNEIEKFVYLYRNRDKHYKLFDYRDLD